MSLQPEIMHQLKNAIAADLSTVVQRLGPMPDPCGEDIKGFLNGDDDAALLALGVALQNAWDRQDYLELPADLAAIKDGQRRWRRR